MFWLGLACFLAHLAGNPHYGFFRDELYYIACGRHPAWGYVDQPPLVPVLAAGSQMAGVSLVALRAVAAALSGASVLVVCRLTAELGGGRFAVALAACASALAPVLMIFGTILIPDSVQLVLWPLGILFVLRAVERDPRWWLVAGAVLGVAGEAKYSAVILACALLFGLVCTQRRASLVSWYLVGGLAIAAVLLMPDLVWQWRHGLPMLEVLRAGQEWKNVLLSPAAFLWQQVMITNPVLAPIWMAGLVWCLAGHGPRWLGVGACALLAAMIGLHGKAYYGAAIYPALFAAGGVAVERLIAGQVVWQRSVLGVALAAGLVLVPMSMPVLPEEAMLAYTRTLARAGLVPMENEKHRSAALGQIYADMHGWQELADQVSKIVASLPAGTRVFTANYGEAAAIDVLTPAGVLPRTLSGHNQYWVWGPGDWNGRVTVDVGGKVDEDRPICASAEVVGIFSAAYVMPGEDGRQIVLCRGLKMPISALWARAKHFE